MPTAVTVTEFIQKVRENFSNRISHKTGWGKNDVMEQFNLTLADVSLELLGSDVVAHATRQSEIYDYFIVYTDYDGKRQWAIHTLPRSMSRFDIMHFMRDIRAQEILSVGYLGPTKKTPD